MEIEAIVAPETITAPAWIGVAGVAIGSILTYALSRLSWRRDRRDRWDQRRLRVYASFLSCVLRTQRQWMMRLGSESAAELRQAGTMGLDEVLDATASVNLLASPEVKDSAHELLDALQRLVQQALSLRAKSVRGVWSGYDGESMDVLVDDFIDRRVEFERTVQDELDVTHRTHQMKEGTGRSSLDHET